MNIHKVVSPLLCAETSADFLLDLYFSNSSFTRNVIVRHIGILKEGSIIVCINGRQATDEEIKNISSENVQRIDFYDHGHPEHPDVYAVVDYILKPQNTGGTIAINGEQHLNRATGNYDMSGQFFKKNSEVTFYVSNLYNDFNIRRGTISESRFIYPKNVLSRTNMNLPSKQWNNTFNSYLNYSYKTDKSRFYAALRYNTSKTQDHVNSLQSYSDQNSSLHVQDFSKTDNINPGIELFYESKFNRKQTLRVTLTSDYNYNKYIREYTEQAPSISSISSKIKEDYFFLKLFAIYTKTFKNHSTFSGVFIHYLNNSHINQDTNEANNTKDYFYIM